MQSNTLNRFQNVLNKVGKNYLLISSQLLQIFSPKCLLLIQIRDIQFNNALLILTSMDSMMKSKNQLVRNSLIGVGTILNQLNNYFKIWFTKKVSFSILSLFKFKKNQNVTLNNLLMDQNTNSISDCHFIYLHRCIIIQHIINLFYYSFFDSSSFF